MLNSVTTNGNTTLTVNYQILTSALASPLGVRFLRSTDRINNSGDTVLSDVVINNAANLTVGTHSVTFTIGATRGTQVQLPGAVVAQADPTTDYYLLATMDATNAVAEVDTDSFNEDNTVVITGVYATPKAIYVHGGESGDTIQLSYLSSGNITLTFSGSFNASYTYPYDITKDYASTSQFRIRTHGGNDSVSYSAEGSITARPMFEFGGDGNDSLVSGHGNDTLSGGDGIDSMTAVGNVNFTLTNVRLTAVICPG